MEIKNLIKNHCYTAELKNKKDESVEEKTSFVFCFVKTEYREVVEDCPEMLTIKTTGAFWLHNRDNTIEYCPNYYIEFPGNYEFTEIPFEKFKNMKTTYFRCVDKLKKIIFNK